MAAQPIPIPLPNGTYLARSKIANYQRCVNIYAETNPPETDPPTPQTMNLTPGLSLFGEWDMTPGEWRPNGLYLATNDHLYGIRANAVYDIAQSGALTLLGFLTTSTGPVSMSDNSIDMVIVDGSTSGFIVNMTTNAFSPYSDPSFLGATRVGILDTFFIFNQPNSKNFYTSLSNTTLLDPLYIAALSVYPDRLETFRILNRNIWFFCRQDGEIWYDSGGFDFPFAILPGQILEEGIVAHASAERHNLKAFWLSRDIAGRCVVLKGENYRAERVSTFGVEWEWSKYDVVSDAIGMIYQCAGHVYYVLTFPTADRTWVYDITVGMWHEWLWHDTDGFEHRHRANAMCFAFGKTIVGDHTNGKLYYLDYNSFTDADGKPIVRRRGFPHLVGDGPSIVYDRFVAKMECGMIADPNANPEISLRWSDNGGYTWQMPVIASLGRTGQYLYQPRWNGLGMARDRIFELFWAIEAQTALNGAYILASPAAN